MKSGQANQKQATGGQSHFAKGLGSLANGQQEPHGDCHGNCYSDCHGASADRNLLPHSYLDAISCLAYTIGSSIAVPNSLLHS
jgi:hypothetical protein